MEIEYAIETKRRIIIKDNNKVIHFIKDKLYDEYNKFVTFEEVKTYLEHSAPTSLDGWWTTTITDIIYEYINTYASQVIEKYKFVDEDTVEIYDLMMQEED